MQFVLRPIMWVAIAGFAASVLVHLSALAGLPSPFGSATWGLHVGIFVVWLPTILVVQRLAKNVRQADLWKAALRGCPSWVQTGMYVVGGYAIVNFVLLLLQTRGYPKNGVPELIGYRGFSGHWMLFYYVAAATLYSAIRLGDATQRRCPHGHDVSPFADYCESCGAHLQPPAAPS